jgi:AmmeMemoRadiSam system protein B
MQIRKAQFAGSWYPDSPKACEREIRHFLEEGQAAAGPDTSCVGGIVPHAGWFFSGAIACNVIQCLKQGGVPDVIVIFGMHLHPNSSNYLTASGAWQTPFGNLAVEESLAHELSLQFRFQIQTDGEFTRDNTIELQLPFIKYFFNDVKIVPVGVPPHPASLEIGKRAAEISRRLGLKMKVIGSTDLTHYGYNYGFSSHGTGPGAVQWVREENDRRIIDRMLAMDPQGVINEALASQNSCCAGAAAAAVAAAGQLGATTAKSIAYATSYEKSPGDSFVGYVGIIFA